MPQGIQEIQAPIPAALAIFGSLISKYTKNSGIILFHWILFSITGQIDASSSFFLPQCMQYISTHPFYFRAKGFLIFSRSNFSPSVSPKTLISFSTPSTIFPFFTIIRTFFSSLEFRS